MRTSVVALFFLLVGCAGNNDLQHVRLVTTGSGLQMYSMPITLALQLGYYNEEGLDVALEALPSTGKAF